MIGRVVLVSLLSLSACKKKDSPSADPPAGSSNPTTTDTPTGSSKTDTPTTDTPPTTPPGDKRVTDSSGWTAQKGPGFTVNAPGAAKIEQVAATKDVRAFERYTFHKSEFEEYVVEITDLPTEDLDLGMKLNEMRMWLTSHTQSVRSEDLIEASAATGEVTGRDIWYIVDQGDDTLRARSRIFGKGHKLYEVRGVAPEDKAREAEAEKFVESFALTP